ncbi:response regulator [Larkinella soli]|uniref:response regulator n=1 Tax=Larkinella soli TaxID=1770527 RepID=UPI000FFBDC4C|nr:response regulator [Larkinella soli]
MPDSRVIYFVDDASDYRFLVQQVVMRFIPQCRMQFFSDGADLVDWIESGQTPGEDGPKVILLDLDMPKMDGFQTLGVLKQHPQWQSVPVVIITNRDSQEHRQSSLELGASNFLLKPLDLMEIKDLMTKLCNYGGDDRPFVSS